MQNMAEQNPIHLYTKCGSANDLIMVLCCTELPYHMYPYVSQGCTFTFIPDWMGSCHGQKLIETETDSLTALKFSILPMETYFVQKNLAFFKSFSKVYNMPMLLLRWS